MLKTSVKGMLLGAVFCGIAMMSGCAFTSYGPNVGALSVPIPVSPYFQHKQEDKAAAARYDSAMVLDPIPPGQTHVAEDAPSDELVMIKFKEIHNSRGNFPALYEVQHNNVRIVKEKVQDVVDDVRVVPLIGPVQAHHSHWVCKVYYTEIIRNGWPIPYTVRNEEKMEVIPIDLDHFHRAGNVVSGDMGN